MEKYSIAVCDDEPLMGNRLAEDTRAILADAGLPCELQCYTSAGQLLDATRTMPNRFDLILLDIMLDGDNGVEVAAELRANGTASALVFVTSSPDFAVKGYEVNAWRYIVKPWGMDQLEAAILSDYEKRAGAEVIVYHLGTKVFRVPVSDICYVETRDRGSKIVLQNDTLDAPIKLSDIEAMRLSGPLVRCHRGYMVNVEKISHIERYSASVCTGAVIPIGRKFYDEVKEKLLGSLAQ